MADNNRPRGREKNVTGQGKDIYKKGQGLGTGPVGNHTGYSNRPTDNSGNNSPVNGFQTIDQNVAHNTSAGPRAKSKSPLLMIIVAAVVLIFGGKFGLGNLLGSDNTPAPQPSVQNTQPQSSQTTNDLFGSLLSGFTGNLSGASSSTGWTQGSNTSKLDKTVISGARNKYTTIKGNNKDTVTIMVYMCGTDLESKSGMATSDLSEMASATLSSNVNVIVYTGGCTKWNNNIVSSSVNQIYKVENGGLRVLEKNMGTTSMTSPDTLTSFIKWCNKNYSANRNMLIFWDHGGGSVSGYGYDEKNSRSGSMSLAGINSALKKAGMKFDFIGFDACLMATAENALMLTDYADYLIASEETEPGVGWYYTNWLTALSSNTSMSTVEIGKKIADDFVDVCAKNCAGQKTTLSVIDLAELDYTAPAALKAFAEETSSMISSGNYSSISNARAGSREFAPSTKIDQVDLIDLAYNTGTAEGKELAEVLKSAVKYNRTSTNMTNAYGLSIYFPYNNKKYVSTAVSTYDDIGIDSEYSKCIQKFASLQISGQATALTNTSSSTSALPSLLGSFVSPALGSSGSSSSLMGSDLISGMLGSLISGGSSSSSSSSSSLSSALISSVGSQLLSGAASSFFGKAMPIEEMTEYVSNNQFDTSYLRWQDYKGQKVIGMPEEQWNLVQNIELNVFYDDGDGYIDLGLDNVFEFTDEGYLIGEYDGTWLAINNQPVAYYVLDTVDDGVNYSITGRVPAYVNDVRADLILVFDNDHPYGFVAGLVYNYIDGETDTVAKLCDAPKDGDVIDFVCDYYTYKGEYSDSYLFGDQLVVDGELTISNVYIDSVNANPVYRITDIYNQNYWTEVID